jgi:hypothetical protein
MNNPFRIAKISFFQDLISFIYARIPFALQHNLGKYSAIRKAMYYTGIEGIEGDYYEFGVFTGSSFCHAIRSYSALGFFNKRKKPMQFFGFDSFDGFGDAITDEHPFFVDDHFSTDFIKVQKRVLRLAKKQNVEAKLIKGFFNESLYLPENQCSNLASIIFIDCDLEDPSKEALNYCTSKIQDGTVLIVDDFFSYKGLKTKGPVAAVNDWLEANNFTSRVFCHYGIGGVVLIISRNK